MSLSATSQISKSSCLVVFLQEIDAAHVGRKRCPRHQIRSANKTSTRITTSSSRSLDHLMSPQWGCSEWTIISIAMQVYIIDRYYSCKIIIKTTTLQNSNGPTGSQSLQGGHTSDSSKIHELPQPL